MYTLYICGPFANDNNVGQIVSRLAPREKKSTPKRNDDDDDDAIAHCSLRKMGEDFYVYRKH